jgi:hypothetical protein
MLSGLWAGRHSEHAHWHLEFGAEFVWADTQGCAGVVKQTHGFSAQARAFSTQPRAFAPSIVSSIAALPILS